MSYVGFGLGETKARGPDYQYLGVGESLLEITKTKVKDRTNFIFEFRVLEDSRSFRGQPGEHLAGAEVSYCCNAGGTGDRAAMGKQDLKGTLIAILQSTGNDPRELSEAGWDTLMSNLFPDRPHEAGQGPADGVRLISCGYRRTNNDTGEIYKIPNMSFKPVPGQSARPHLVKGFGVPTGNAPPPGRPAAPPAGRPAAAPPAARPAAPTRTWSSSVPGPSPRLVPRTSRRS